MLSRNYIFTFSRKQVNFLASIVRPLSQNLKTVESNGRGNENSLYPLLLILCFLLKIGFIGLSNFKFKQFCVE